MSTKQVLDVTLPSSASSPLVPGGLMVFMCHPRNEDNGALPLAKDKSKIRDLLGIEQSDAVVD
jgi:hypothetical protein